MAVTVSPQQISDRIRTILRRDLKEFSSSGRSLMPEGFETRLRAQIPLLESVVSQMDPQDKITTSETYYAIGNAYNYLANARAMQGDNQSVKPNLLKAAPPEAAEALRKSGHPPGAPSQFQQAGK